MRLRIVLGLTASLTLGLLPTSGLEPVQAQSLTQRADTANPAVLPSFDEELTRLAGSTRYETALEVSRRYGSGVPAVFIATGRDFPDALAAAAAASRLGSPLLLTEPDSLSSSLRAEVQRLAPARIIVVGGTGVISTAVERALGELAPTTRLAGSDRYATALAVVNDVFNDADRVFLATGSTFPDALAASGAAGAVHAPVLLVDGARSEVPGAVLGELARLGVTRVAIAGGTGAVSAGIESQIRRYVDNVDRYAGSDRFGTASAINQAHFDPAFTREILLATGDDFPDALAGAAMAGSLGAPLFITTPACIPLSVQPAIAPFAGANRVVLGGTAVVSSMAAVLASCAIAPPAGPPTSPGTRPTVPNPVTPGAYCAKELAGWYGKSAGGLLMVCSTAPGDTRLRWRAV